MADNNENQEVQGIKERLYQGRGCVYAILVAIIAVSLIAFAWAGLAF